MKVIRVQIVIRLLLIVLMLSYQTHRSRSLNGFLQSIYNYIILNSSKFSYSNSFIKKFYIFNPRGSVVASLVVLDESSYINTNVRRYKCLRSSILTKIANESIT